MTRVDSDGRQLGRHEEKARLHQTRRRSAVATLERRGQLRALRRAAPSRGGQRSRRSPSCSWSAVASDAAGRMRRPRCRSEVWGGLALGRQREKPPLAGYEVVARDDRAPRDPALQLVPAPFTPVADLRPLPQLADRYEGHPHSGPDYVPVHPWRRPLLLDQRCDICVDDDKGTAGQPTEESRDSLRSARKASSSSSEPHMSATNSAGSATGSAWRRLANSASVNEGSPRASMWLSSLTGPVYDRPAAAVSGWKPCGHWQPQRRSRPAGGREMEANDFRGQFSRRHPSANASLDRHLDRQVDARWRSTLDGLGSHTSSDQH